MSTPALEVTTVLAVAAGAGLGAAVRYGAERWHVHARHGRPPNERDLPWATFAVNVVGSALLGAVVALAVSGRLADLALAGLGAGLAGGLTTFSTFALDVVELLREGRRATTAAYVLLSLVLGTAAAAGAYTLLVHLAG